MGCCLPHGKIDGNSGVNQCTIAFFSERRHDVMQKWRVFPKSHHF